MAEEMNCTICYENNPKGIPCKVCKKEMCINCEYTLINQKCPFCRGEILNWYNKFVEATPQHRDFFIDRYNKDRELEIINYNRRLKLLELVIRTKNLDILKIFKGKSVGKVLGCIRELISIYISTKKTILEIEMCLQMIRYLKKQNFKRELWHSCLYNDTVIEYIDNCMFTGKSIYNNMYKNRHIHKRFIDMKNLIKEISDVVIVIEHIGNEQIYSNNHSKYSKYPRLSRNVYTRPIQQPRN
jgi:hypothetical protein